MSVLVVACETVLRSLLAKCNICSPVESKQNGVLHSSSGDCSNRSRSSDHTFDSHRVTGKYANVGDVSAKCIGTRKSMEREVSKDTDGGLEHNEERCVRYYRWNAADHGRNSINIVNRST